MPIYALGDQVPDIDATAFIHPDAVVIGAVTIGAESSVWPGAVLRGDDGEIFVGSRSNIQDNCVLHTTAETPTRVGNRCVIGHLVHLEACTIEDDALVGNAAMVLHRSVVHSWSVVAANSVVLYDVDVPSGALAAGSPAVIKEGRAQREMITHAVESYVAPRGALPARAAAVGLILAVTVVTVPAADAELAADRLMQAGAFAVEERTATGGMVELCAVLSESDASARRLIGKLPAAWSLRTEEVDPTPADTWRAHAMPVQIAPDLVLRPAWVPSLDEPGVTEAAIDPGATFGLGDHPTTRLSAAVVWRTRPIPQRVLDVGAGSGVLAIVAVLAGAESASAIDVADVSPATVADNAARNGVADRITASTTPLAAIDGIFDLVVANILAPELVALVPDLRRVTALGGTLIVSGVLADRYDHVVAALAPMELVSVDALDGWAALELRQPRGGLVSGTRR